MRAFFRSLLLIMSLVWSSRAWSWTPWIFEDRTYSAYVGVGPALAFPQVRLGGDEWEGGILTSKAIGFDKIFREGSTYAAFGLVYQTTSPAGGGFYGAVGVEFPFWKYFSFRSELNSVAASNGFVRGEATAGLGLHVRF